MEIWRWVLCWFGYQLFRFTRLVSIYSCSERISHSSESIKSIQRDGVHSNGWVWWNWIMRIIFSSENSTIWMGIRWRCQCSRDIRPHWPLTRFPTSFCRRISWTFWRIRVDMVESTVWFLVTWREHWISPPLWSHRMAVILAIDKATELSSVNMFVIRQNCIRISINNFGLGSIGDVLYRNTYVSFNGRFITNYGTDDIEYMFPYYFDKLCIIAPKALQIPEWMAIFKCFHVSVWLAFLVMNSLCGWFWFLLRRSIVIQE